MAREEGAPSLQEMATPEHSGTLAAAAHRCQLERHAGAQPARACLPHCSVTAWRRWSLLKEAAGIGVVITTCMHAP